MQIRLPRAVRVAGTAAAAVALVAGAASAAPAMAASSSSSPAWLHGKNPGRYFPTKAVYNGHAGVFAITGALHYGGGVDGIGVTTGHEKVYLVFYGSQWGTASTGSDGYQHYTGDTQGMAPRLQALFKGLGTNNELWSGVNTQYCEGVASGATSCPGTAPHVAYPTGGALSGVWEDNSVSSPSAATAAQLGTEAVKAASHFSNTSASLNRNAQYVIVSPPGTNPDNYQTGGFCAWHDWNGDVGVSSSVGDVAFTNLPYLTDAGSGCGMNYVNAGSAGTLDGVTIVEGHEYAETITDQNPAGGWTDSGGNENADKCAWNGVGGTGGASNVSMSTGSFAMQATWSNDTNGCAISHAIVGGGGGGNTVTVNNPGNQSSTVGQSVSLQITGSDSGGLSLTYSATGLPTGTSISTSGLISGTTSTAGTYSVTVTAKDSTNASGSTSFTWTVGSGGGCTGAGQKLGNPGFETGTASPWTASAGVISANGSGESSHSGTYFAWLDGYGTTHTDTLSQSVTIPAGCTTYTFSFWLHIDTAETTTTTQFDKLTVQIGTTTLATYSNLNHNTGYAQKSFSVSGFAGQTVTVKFTGTEDSSLQTSFVIDDTALNVS
ncbi:MAG: putative Ig domain-containing protein [Frankiaceae bacterium]